MYRIRLHRGLPSLLLVLALAGVGLAAYMVICGGPTLTINGNSQRKEFETRFLGEYCDSLSKVRVLDMTEHVVVWEVVADPNVAFCDFVLSPGENPATVRGIARVIIPSHSDTFMLSRGRKYEVTVWGQAANFSCGASSQVIEF
jgi:hypothetical protein